MSHDQCFVLSVGHTTYDTTNRWGIENKNVKYFAVIFIFDFIYLIIKLIFSLFTSKFKPALLQHLVTIISVNYIFVVNI